MASRILVNALRLNRIFLQSTTQNLFASYCVVKNDGTNSSSPVSKQFFKKPSILKVASPLNPNDLLNNLKAEVNNFGYINIENISKFTELLNDETLQISEDDAIFLLESTNYMPSNSRESRMEIFNKIWEHLNNNNQLNKAHYLTALKVFQENMVPVSDACSILEKSGLDGDSEIYEELILLACEHGNIKHATEILTEMRKRKLVLTVNIFNALIRGHSKNKDIDQCKYMLETMNATAVAPNSDTYSELLMAFIECNEQNDIHKILETHGGTFNTQQILKIIKCSAFNSNIEPINYLLKKLPSDWINVTELPPAIRNICTELIYKRYIDEAVSILNAFPKQKFNETQSIDSFGAYFIRDLIRSGTETDKVIEICLNLITSEKNTRALHIACEFALKYQSKQALSYLKALSQREQLRPHYFWPLILQSSEENGEIGVLNILKEMIALKIEIDYETLSQFLLPRLKLTLENEKEGLKTLEACGIKTSKMLTPVLLNLIQEQNLETVSTICQLYPTKIDTSKFVNILAKMAVSKYFVENFSQLAKVIATLSRKSENPKFDLGGQLLLDLIAIPKLKKHPRLLIHIIDELKLAGVHLSSNAADDVIEYLTYNVKKDNKESIRLLKEMIDTNLSYHNTESSNTQITHPRDMSLNDLECHLIELESKRLNTRGVLRRLLQLLVKEGRHERALVIKQKCDELNVHMSAGMLASLFDMQTKLNNFENAAKTLNQIQTTYPEFRIDEFKIIDFATLLTKTGKLPEAKKVLNDYASTKRVIGGDNIMKNLWNLLNQTAIRASHSSKLIPNVNITKELFQFLHRSGYCTAHNALLGPIIREWILRKEIKMAVTEFGEIVEKYKRTPLQFELLSLLVGLSNSHDIEIYKITAEDAKHWLQTLTTYVARIHGTTNMNNALLLAVAESGVEKQIRKMLINPEFRINCDSLIKNCEHLSNTGKTSTLLKLAKASRGLARTIKEEDIYNLLLKNFIKENNTEAAINLFNTLEADDELKISQEFVKNLVRLLKINNQQLPSNLSLKAHVI